MADYLLLSWAVSLVPRHCSFHELEVGFRGLHLVIGRIENERYLLDARLIKADEFSGIATAYTIALVRIGDYFFACGIGLSEGYC